MEQGPTVLWQSQSLLSKPVTSNFKRVTLLPHMAHWFKSNACSQGV